VPSAYRHTHSDPKLVDKVDCSRICLPIETAIHCDDVVCLRTQRLMKAYRGRRVVDDVSFQVAKGEIVGLLGPNGAGKTTSFNMAVGLVRPDAGEVEVTGVSMTRAPMHERARRGLGYLPQEASIFRRMTAVGNLRTVLEFRKDLHQRARVQEADRLIEEFELAHVRDSLGENLSGGERRRVEIARCLAAKPACLLLDEPFAGIDPIAVADLQQLIRSLKERGIGVLITDHNVRETLKICDRAYILVAGRVIEQGNREAIAESEIARRFYLGEDFSL
jgi:lipopolysaccharide export system ATP-binding protein